MSYFTTFLVILLGCYHATVFSKDGSSPASLPTHPYDVNSTLELPKDIKNGKYIVKCETIVQRSGRLRTTSCYSAKKIDKGIVKAVQRLSRKLKLAPAKVGEKPTQVLLQFMVLIKVVEKKSGAILVLNHGYNTTEFGFNYIAPQRTNKFSFDWGAEGVYRLPKVSDMWVWFELQIAPDGTYDDIVIHNPSNVPNSVVTRLRREVKGMHFFPGYFNMSPVSMRYVESIHDNRGTAGNFDRIPDNGLHH